MDRYPYHWYTILLGATRALAHIGVDFTHHVFGLSMVLERCKAKNLVPKWEKFHFVVREGIVLGHHVSKEGLEVDMAKIPP